MTYHLTYTIGFGKSSTSIAQSFQTEAARNQFMTSRMPSDAKSIRYWPTQYVPKQQTKWWDANKRPFADRYDLINETR